MESESNKRKFSEVESGGSTSQPRIDEAMGSRTINSKSAKYARTDPRSKRIDRAVVEMHTLDLQPFTLCEKRGFKKLVAALNPHYEVAGRQYYQSRTLKAYDKAVEAVKTKLKKDSPDSITLLIDGWSSFRFGYIGLIAVYLNPNFERVVLCLAVAPFDESETGDNLTAFVNEKLEEWEIKTSTNLIISDSAANMLKMGRQLNMKHLPCIIHSLQLVIKKEVFEDHHMKRISKIMRRIANYASISNQLNVFIREIQERLGEDLLMFISDCKTRWDSWYLMAERFIKLENVVKEILSNHEWRQKLEGKKKKRRVVEDEELSEEMDLSLSAADWNILSRVVEVLKPFKEATEEFSKSIANISKIIPVISTLMEAVQEKRHDFKVVKDFKKKIRGELSERLGDKVEAEDMYTLATLIDPTVKDALFRDKELMKIAKTELERQVVEEARKQVGNNNEETRVVENEEVENPSTSGSLMERMKANLAKQKKVTTSTFSVKKRVEIALREYFEEELEPIRLLKYWKTKMETAKLEDDKIKIALCEVAKKYLTPPPSTVDVERLFSTCGNVLAPKRNRLLPSSLEKIVFLRNNYLLTGIDYD